MYFQFLIYLYVLLYQYLYLMLADYLKIPHNSSLKAGEVTTWLRSAGMPLQKYDNVDITVIQHHLDDLLKNSESKSTFWIKHGRYSTPLVAFTDDTHFFIKVNTQALLTQRVEIEERLATLSTYARALGHDLATPLQNIALNAELIKLLSNNEAKISEKLGVISNNVFVAQELLANLSSFAKMSGGTEEVCDMSEVLFHVKGLESTNINRLQAQLAFGTFSPIKISSFDMVIVFKNLIQNSLKFRSDRRPQILIVEKFTEDHYIIHYQDNGIGIPENDQTNIFDAYRRGSNTGKIPGTGVGLNTIQNLIHQNGGTVELESPIIKHNMHTVSQGTIFKLKFPRSILA